ncbi:mannose-1-phosphate guanylyltransferase/mannose-6-phosphate isomerase [Pandoraea sputorum]|uniref:mannose-1-phosphate guanylyltransferase n=1 Tax=Pandoraea sputorum TaxID=93222 RepID=A0A239SY93_9BURK|nr:mannose-1-phosphate guanylyltransferase/mannose-6-phosphate isomerase [Pandoraea sputorum]SNU90209.1 Alginate biosynthesis protein AlgA [Pandoraea sputorum]VVE35186.1 mannose-1-phosphate guanylyltransferase/mannose-6-phosphate isomerase [Pandoraea sputorum]
MTLDADNLIKSHITPVVLCGGAGTRLWPLSRKLFPKQFIPLVGNKSLLRLTLERLRGLNGVQISSNVVCVAAEDHRFLVAEALEQSGVAGTVLLEPAARNTAAAMTLAAVNAAPDATLLFCPADHYIPDADAFTAMVREATQALTDDTIVTFGVVPTFPSTAYGYIEMDAREHAQALYPVSRFIEKPVFQRAHELISQGNVLWNAGIFLCRAKALIVAMHEHADDILVQCRETMANASYDRQFVRPEREAFLACRSESFDYAVMERHANVRVAPFKGAWSDVGSWNAVADLTPADDAGNRIDGDGHAINASNTFIHAPCRPVVALGTQDMLIVDTPDAVLVTTREHVEQVKHVVAELDRKGRPHVALHRKVARPWGWYDSVDAGERFQVKRICVKPGASLSLQKHHHRAEHWIVVNGTAEVTRGEATFLLTENQSTYIPIGEIHRLHNPGKTHLEMIEVQSGSYLGEDDIVRLEDTYGRTTEKN